MMSSFGFILGPAGKCWLQDGFTFQTTPWDMARNPSEPSRQRPMTCALISGKIVHQVLNSRKHMKIRSSSQEVYGLTTQTLPRSAGFQTCRIADFQSADSPPRNSERFSETPHHGAQRGFTRIPKMF
jgi:hypothetical protein